MKTIVVGVDFSGATSVLVAKAVEMAKALKGQLRLVHILEPQPSYSAYGFSTEEFPVVQDFQHQAHQLAEKKLGALAAELESSGLDINTQLAVGSPTYEMEAILTSLDDCLLVVGTHGHNLVGSILLGSVAEALVRKAVVPTLVVPIGQS